jgi:hypothetical protein
MGQQLANPGRVAAGIRIEFQKAKIYQARARPPVIPDSTNLLGNHLIGAERVIFLRGASGQNKIREEPVLIRAVQFTAVP